MAFTAGEVQNVANAAMDFYINKGDQFRQTITTMGSSSPDVELTDEARSALLDAFRDPPG